jgi:ATP-dependent DNA helicase PIF1
MLHGNIFTLVNQICHFHTNFNKEIKFQFILVADMYQLGPIPNKCDTKDTPLYAFETKTWKEMDLQPVFLTEVMRQKDENFISTLNDIRVGNFSNECKEMIEKATDNEKIPGMQYVKLFCKNMDKDAANRKHLSAIDEESHFFKADDRGKDGLLKNILADGNIELKIGAKVMLLVNKPSQNLFNGSIGVITDFRDEIYPTGRYDRYGQPEKLSECLPVVQFNNGIKISIERNLWEIEERTDRGNFIVAASRFQIPLSLAWAISIHKSQSLQFSHVICDFESVFGTGLVYVALSRAISPEGLIVKNFLRKFVKKNKRVDDFYKSLI